jgi:acyltransferase
VTIAVSRAPARGWKMIRARLPRIALLLVLGYALHLPGWNMRGLLSGDRTIWRHLLAFDALHVIAAGLLGAVLVLAPHWGRLRQGVAFVLLATVAVAMGMRAPTQLPTTLSALAFMQAVGGTSTFPMFPWVAYFFIGAAAPLLMGDVRARCAVGLVLVAAFLAASACWQGFGSMPPAHPLLVSFRVGVVLLLLAALEAVPVRVAAVLSPVTGSSLAVYVIHVPVVYGWFTVQGLAQRVGPRLPFHHAALVALTVLAGALAVERARKVAWARATTSRRVLEWQLRPTRPGSESPDVPSPFDLYAGPPRDRHDALSWGGVRTGFRLGSGSQPEGPNDPLRP